LSTRSASLQDDECFGKVQRKIPRGTLVESSFIFLVSYPVLFFGMSRRPNIYDEGLILTGAMRVAAGQIPHRDFYANYGPAQFYILAGLFKVFGESLLVERLYDLLIKALVVACVYAIASSYCRRSIAAYTSIVALLWLIGLNAWSGSPMIPVSLLNLIGSALILPVFLRSVSTRRMCAAGAVAGAAALFRYDTGVALLGVHACVIAIAICLRIEGMANRMRTFANTFWPYLAGFAVVTFLPALYYLSVAPLDPVVYDIILYTRHNYYRSRNLPFPAISLRELDYLGIYLPVVVVGVSLYALVRGGWRARSNGGSSFQSALEGQKWHGILVTFGLLVLVMYLKGFVRVGLFQLYLAIIPSLLLTAVLFQHRARFPGPVRFTVTSLLCLSFLAAAWSTLHQVKELYGKHLSTPGRILSSALRTAPETKWCDGTNPLTKGFCFLPEDNRVQTIEFIDSHTMPDQRLYVGTTKHDRIFANDNLIYFATQRLPATMWSHFDPGLQNNYDIQTQMIHELKVTSPPYVVLDSEYDSVREPNDSSKSTGVTLLDDYIRNRYQPIRTFGSLSVWQEIHSP
jgi:Dolichyl-phosphate-mannose-protein mannosyltransferase